MWSCIEPTRYNMQRVQMSSIHAVAYKRLPSLQQGNVR